MEFTKEEIIRLYNEGGEQTKQRLIEKFGIGFFSNKDKEWIQCFELFCKANNLSITNDAKVARTNTGYAYLPHAEPENAEERHDNASRMLRTIIAHRNKIKNFKRSYKNRGYIPIFIEKESGLVFSYALYGYWVSDSVADVCAPFELSSSEEAEVMARKYFPIYEKYLLTQ